MSRGSRFTAAVVLGAALAAGAGLLAVAPATAAPAAPAVTAPSAATILKSFDPGDIISDAVMYNASSMTEAQIQAFLDSEQPTCSSGYTCLRSYTANTQTMAANLMCGKYTGAKNETAAAIVYKVAQACRINPQVLLVTMQKEQGLVTGVNLSWYPDAYRSATGLGCPDDAPCDPAKYGFFNQVYGAGYWLIRYTTPPGTTGPGWTDFDRYPVGKTSSILYNPDPSCGARSVKIANKATESLYVYTPYTPNSAALAAGYGVGNSCSAYGNRNFFLYFTQWFGSTHITVSGAIGAYWTKHGGASGPLGAATANAVTSTQNGGGSSQTFQHGTVFTSKLGTFAVTGALLTEYDRRGGVGGSLLWPAADQVAVTANGGGLSQRFGSGYLYSSKAGTYAVRADLLAAYQAQGGVTGPLGFPTDTASALDGGWVQHFTKGTTYFATGTGGYGVPSAVDAGYVKRQGPAGPLGWPTSVPATRSADAITGTVQGFQKGDIYSSSIATAAVMSVPQTVLGGALGGPVDSLGWPKADAVATTAAGGGTEQVFTDGRLYVQSGRAPVAVAGSLLTAYLAAGDVGGALGWPVAAATSEREHGVTETAQPFEHGGAYAAGSTVRTVSGALATAYAAAGGPAGALGWPTGAARTSTAAGGGSMQAFQTATLYRSTASGAAVPVSGSILALYVARGEAGGSLGWPSAAATTVTAHGASATVQSFATGAIYVRGSSARSVTGGLFAEYAALGGPTGSLGWVTGDAHHLTDGRGIGGWSQTFTGGTEYYDGAITKAFPVAGAILTRYTAMGGPSSGLGWPTAAAASQTVGGATRTVQPFTLGAAYANGSAVQTVVGTTFADYTAEGGPTGPLGWVTGPSVHTAANKGGWVQPFAGGTSFYSSTTKQAHSLRGAMLALYDHRGGVSGTLGWPGATQVLTDGIGGSMVEFTSGRMYSSAAGTAAVRLDILAAYLKLGGPASTLGWPVHDASVKDGVSTQRFQHGTIVWKNGKATITPTS